MKSYIFQSQSQPFMQISVYIATSLDGYIARENGDIDWLTSKDYLIEDEDYGFAEFFSSVTCMVMGRNTFEKVLSFPDWPYSGKRVILMSSSLTEIPDHLSSQVELFRGTPQQLVEKLKEEKEQRIYLDGGQVIQSFLLLGLIDDMIISHIPVLIGSGRPLFGQIQQDIKLAHLTTKTFASGLVQSCYKTA